MTPGALDHRAYQWRGSSERMICVGADGPALLFLAPLFEEANRTRHFMIEAMRALAARGHACFLPDLPGTLESLTPLETLGWDDWTGAVTAAAQTIGAPCRTVAMRGGCLLDKAAGPLARWRLAPQDGTTLMRELVRIRMAANREDAIVTTAAAIEAEAAAAPFEVAGYRLSPPFTGALKAAALDPAAAVRTVRLEGDIQPADRKIAAQPLWRRSEPDHDPAFCAAIVADIAAWSKTCAAG